MAALSEFKAHNFIIQANIILSKVHRVCSNLKSLFFSCRLSTFKVRVISEGWILTKWGMSLKFHKENEKVRTFSYSQQSRSLKFLIGELHAL